MCSLKCVNKFFNLLLDFFIRHLHCSGYGLNFCVHELIVFCVHKLIVLWMTCLSCILTCGCANHWRTHFWAKNCMQVSVLGFSVRTVLPLSLLGGTLLHLVTVTPCRLCLDLWSCESSKHVCRICCLVLSCLCHSKCMPRMQYVSGFVCI